MSPERASFLAFSDERRKLALTFYSTGTAIASARKRTGKVTLYSQAF